MPTWTTFLRIIVLLAIGGFTLMIVSGYWHVLALLVFGALAIWLWRHWPQSRR